MSWFLKFENLRKINDCKKCEGTGTYQWFDLDGGPYYSWMKPKKETCQECKGKILND